MRVRSIITSIVLPLILGLLSISCTDFIAKVEREEDWAVLDSGNIVLHYRIPEHSQEASPTIEQARYIVRAQNIYYTAIQDSINKYYNDKVLIYLYNHDEAKDKIGTNGGGHALPKFNSYYYTFIDSNRSITDHFSVVDPFIGAHELVHVITHRTLGYPGTKLLSEGYAVWIDGTFARFHIKDIMIHYRDNVPEKILDPDSMLFNANSIDDSIYYPNCGFFTQFIVYTYGIENINSLFNVNEEDFITRFESITGDSWQELCSAYAAHLGNL